MLLLIVVVRDDNYLCCVVVEGSVPLPSGCNGWVGEREGVVGHTKTNTGREC